MEFDRRFGSTMDIPLHTNVAGFPYRPNRQFDWNRLRILSTFSIWMFFSNLMGRLIANADYFLIGRFLGATSLGYYTWHFNW